MNRVLVFNLAFVLRLCLLFYGEWQDAHFPVKYTDIDYQVFRDAASFVASNGTPYDRATYRYTPLLAWMLVPGIRLGISGLWGKLIFISSDLLVAAISLNICKKMNINPKTALLAVSFVWLFNPMVFAISTRGNAESFIGLLVLTTLSLLYQAKSSLKRGNIFVFLAGIFFGLSVHFKIYPIIFIIPILMWLSDESIKNQNLIKRFLNRTVIMFSICSFLTFSLMGIAFYGMYGFEFLQHTYLYHISRQDHRHNFSIYFYLLYLLSASPESNYGKIVGLFSFIPQAALILAVGFKYGKKDLAFSWFLQTLLFVTFNKVITSQYFLWYISLLPLVLPKLSMGLMRGIMLVVLWFLGQGPWLYFAYKLEFEGQNTFWKIWLSGLFFFLVNVFVAYSLIKSYKKSVRNVNKLRND